MTTPEILFDRSLLQRRKARAYRQAARGGAAPDFLLARACEDVAWRIGAINRRFDTAVVVGGLDGTLARHLAGLGNVGRVLEIETCAELAGCRPGAVVVADEEALPLAASSVDLVASALTLQLVNDLPGVLAQVRRALRPDGLLMAALLGGRTLNELREAFLAAEAEVEGGVSPRVAPFADVRDLGGLLQRARLALPVTDVDTIEVGYRNPLALLHDLRAMGATNVLTSRRRTPLRRTTLARALEIYAERFARADGRVRATFEIVTMTGWVPHESQQQALRPGSAKARLADALGTREQAAGEAAPASRPFKSST